MQIVGDSLVTFLDISRNISAALNITVLIPALSRAIVTFSKSPNIWLSFQMSNWRHVNRVEAIIVAVNIVYNCKSFFIAIRSSIFDKSYLFFVIYSYI